MRNDQDTNTPADEIQPDEESTGVVMHKDSVWNQQWENFKNSKVGESKLRPEGSKYRLKLLGIITSVKVPNGAVKG